MGPLLRTSQMWIEFPPQLFPVNSRRVVVFWCLHTSTADKRNRSYVRSTSQLLGVEWNKIKHQIKSKSNERVASKKRWRKLFLCFFFTFYHILSLFLCIWLLIIFHSTPRANKESTLRSADPWCDLPLTSNLYVWRTRAYVPNETSHWDVHCDLGLDPQ